MEKVVLDIFETELIYHKEYDFFCFDSCVRQIIESYGNPHLYFIMNYSIGLEIVRERGDFQIITEKDYDCLLPEYLSRFHFYNGYNTGREQIWKDNKRVIQEGYPIIVDVDTYYLPYLPYFKKSHGKHAVIIAGYDDDMVTIIDWFSTWLFKGRINSQQLWDARLPYNRSAINGSWAYLEKFDQKVLDVSYLIRRNIEITLNQYCTQGESIRGINALEEIIFILEKERDCDLISLKWFISYLSRELHITAMRKSLFVLFLKSAYNITGEKMIFDCLNNMTINVQIWTKLIYQLMIGSYKPEMCFFRIIYLIHEIIKLETKVMFQLKEILCKNL